MPLKAAALAQSQRPGRRGVDPVVAEPDMGGLRDHSHAIEQDDLMVPVELIGFTRRKTSDLGCSRRLSALLASSPGVAPHGVVAAVKARPRSSSKIRIKRQGQTDL